MGKNEFIAVRASAETVKKLDDVAKQYKTTRTNLIRELSEYSDYLYPLLRKEAVRKEEETNKIIEEMSREMIKMVMNKMSVEMMHTFEKAVHLTVEKMASEEGKENDITDK
jgi:hypothetical protein